MGFVRFIAALIGSFAVCAISILIVALISPDSPGIGVGLALFLPAACFFVLIGGVLIELMVKLLPLKTWQTGFWASAVLGIVYACLVLVLVTLTLRNPIDLMGWVWTGAMFVIALLVFYTIRTKGFERKTSRQL
ncbi:hypothetical protein ACFO4N_10995 [Camelliibacillus cellulosilyticus]|uniref:Superfamily IV 4 TMS phage holin n=1 Tax=Camelliibacillus cellulosilyticus TaxID=2174486 RepID=A0ABV9GRE2_9BACL